MERDVALFVSAFEVIIVRRRDYRIYLLGNKERLLNNRCRATVFSFVDVMTSYVKSHVNLCPFSLIVPFSSVP